MEYKVELPHLMGLEIPEGIICINENTIYLNYYYCHYHYYHSKSTMYESFCICYLCFLQPGVRVVVREDDETE